MALIVGELAAVLDLDKKPYDKGLKDADSGFRGFLSGITDKAKKIAKIGAGVITGVLTTALVKGWQRLTGIENAEAKLAGLGHTARGVESIMKDALASVKGTAFGMDEAATTAAGAVAAGVKPGKELERYLRLTADAATIAGTSMGEMGAIINKVTTAGKAQADNLNQLADRGIPIFQWLREEYKVSAEELSKMVASGKVDAETFRRVIEDNIGGAALKSGDTTQGAFKNMLAAAGRFGARMLKGVFPLAKEAFGGIQDLFDDLSDKAGPTIDRVSDSLAGLWTVLVKGEFSKPIFGQQQDSGLVDFLLKVRERIKGLPELAKSLRDRVREFMDSAEFQRIQTDTLDKLRNIWDRLVPALKEAWPAIKQIGEQFARSARQIGVASWMGLLSASEQLIPVLAEQLAPVLNTIAGVLEDCPGLLTALIAAFGAWKVATEAAAIATKIASGIQAAFNAVMAANPIMLVVIAIAALAAAFYVAYQRVGWFRNGVDAIGRFLRDKFWPVLKDVGAFIKDTIWPVLKDVADFLIGVFKGAVEGAAAAWRDVLWPALQAVGSFVTETLWPALKAVGGWLADVFGPIIRELARHWTDLMWPALRKVAGFLTDTVWPILKTVGGFIGGAFKVAVDALAWVWSNVLWPALKLVAAYITQVVWPVFQKVADVFISVGATVGRIAGEIVGFIVSIPRRIAGAVSTMWNGITSGISTAAGWVRDRVDDIVGFVAGIPGRIGRFLSGVADLVAGPFRSAIDGIRRIWNNTIGGRGFTMPDIPGLPGRGQRFEIPKMHTGGVVPGSGDVPILAQGGERVLSRAADAQLQRALAALGDVARSGMARVAPPVPAGAPGAARVEVTIPLAFHGPVLGDADREIVDAVNRAARTGARIVADALEAA